ncbi:MAG TPA: hypothetical protein VNQ76_07470 [Planctomicrobium sp.]|nr:hypothetical protein [Planctomicrobium sp.]
MKSRNLFGGAIVGALLVGIWFGSFFKGPGLGGNGATGDGMTAESLSSSRDEARSITETGNSSPRASTGRSQGEATGPEFGLPTQLITIVVYGNQYRQILGDDPTQGRPVSLQEIQRLSEETVGTTDGIRVRILKERSAQEGARSDLLAALAAVGIKREAIQERAEFLPNSNL